MPGAGSGLRLALRRVVVGYRAVAAGWSTVLGLILLLDPDPPVGSRGEVILGTLLLTLGWAALTAALAARAPGVLSAPGWLIADALVAAWTVLASQVAGAEVAFAGGYPFSAVLGGVYARGLTGGLTAAVVLALAFLVRLSVSGLEALPEVNNALIYLVAAGVLAWGLTVLERAEIARVRGEADLAEERAERRRSQELAETAAHLHDSVLQTLALLQRRADDPAEVTTLARRQERELREWLAGRAGGTAAGQRTDGSGAVLTLRAAVELVVAAVERDHRVPIEAVVVGDAPLDEGLRALVAATREALVNAAVHSGAPQVALYAEADAVGARVWVRDRGVGFLRDEVPADRRGISQSIEERLAHVTGTARFTSAPGQGTEVELTAPVGGRAVAARDDHGP